MNKLSHIKNWLSLSETNIQNAYTATSNSIGLPPFAVEKDWWVVHTLALIFSMDCAKALIFKGGTSLSKGWNLIERFSEDIDLALDREYIGFGGELSKTQVKKLKSASYDFMTKIFVPELQAKFNDVGFKDVNVKYRAVENHDQDPLIIEIYYPKLTEKDEYLKPGVLVEVGCRSLKEPITPRTFGTLVAENFKDSPFADSPITIPIVNPERTFLEKVFLLHEEFQKPADKIKVARLSRHLYDIEKLSQTEYAQIALQDKELYDTIIAHRKRFTPISGIDYDKHQPQHIRFIPPAHLLPLWESDYKEMREKMIYGNPLSFDDLIKKLSELQNLINNPQ
ncbi:nucleotidyl transferase AbiEii/AbiGii toxin family protein [Emticicia sp.]|uniref:nucleotidyl transferase AbiEii/AbiGii toxin family protein n=1 Tax=Emticicia sp. TaxID=1930953 RepID=UPI0037538EF4